MYGDVQCTPLYNPCTPSLKEKALYRAVLQALVHPVHHFGQSTYIFFFLPCPIFGKVSDERFEQMSANYDNEQKQLKQTVSELAAYIEQTEQKTADISNFIHLVRRYTYVNELTPEIMHELIDKIVVHAPDKSSGHRQQKVEIHFRFNVATAAAVLDRRDYDKRGKAA